ncbi:MAG TPA: hypothetical protein VHF69_07695 [Candidatus Synoicihabitans sp.]|nr:hypothetical protein [Candidatus Synoicihabitans sp.]
MSARSWKVWFIFAGVFIAGAIAGGFVSLRVAKTVASKQRVPDDWPVRIMQRFSDRLELTEAQRAAIVPHVDRAAEELTRTRAESAEAIQRMEGAVARVLTAEQRETFETMQAEQRERWKRWIEKREKQLRHSESDKHKDPKDSKEHKELKEPK